LLFCVIVIVALPTEGIAGVQVRSQYLPEVATVHKLGLPDKSQYLPLVATVHKLGLPAKSL